MVAEGVKTTSVAMELAARHGVDLPIAAEMHAVLNQGRSPAEAIKRLMGRSASKRSRSNGQTTVAPD